MRVSHPHRVPDIAHADFDRDPMPTLDRIYAFIGLDIRRDTRPGFARRIGDKPELSYGVHRYGIADYGMTEDEVRTSFPNYVSRNDLLEKRR